MASGAAHPASETSFIDPSDPFTRHPFARLGDPWSIDLSVIVPAYNEEARLPTMLDETLSYLEGRRRATLANSSSSSSSGGGGAFTYEVIVVDDGSRDRTAEVALQYVAKYSTERVRLLRMVRNAGKGGAVRRGMLSARGRRLLMADADAATSFDDLEALERAFEGDVDVAVGSRAHLRDAKKGRAGGSACAGGSCAVAGDFEKKDGKAGKGRDALRSFVSMVFNLVVVYIGGVVGCRDTQCGFKLYSRKAARVAFEGQHLDRWAFDVENLYRVQTAKMKVVEVPVRWSEVPGSKLSVIKATINMAWDMLRMRFRYETGSWTVSAPY